MKKRGFGEGWWNGYGGKVQDGESMTDAMVRELQEESDLVAKNTEKEQLLNSFLMDLTTKWRCMFLKFRIMMVSWLRPKK